MGAKTTLPDLLAVVGPLFDKCAPDEQRILLAVLERLAAEHYRRWANGLSDPEQRRDFLTAAALEDTSHPWRKGWNRKLQRSQRGSGSVSRICAPSTRMRSQISAIRNNGKFNPRASTAVPGYGTRSPKPKRIRRCGRSS
jgi:hypothetical protein